MSLTSPGHLLLYFGVFLFILAVVFTAVYLNGKKRDVLERVSRNIQPVANRQTTGRIAHTARPFSTADINPTERVSGETESIYTESFRPSNAITEDLGNPENDPAQH